MMNAEQTVDAFMKYVFRYHGLPCEIVSDRGPQFISKFWAKVFELFRTKLNLSSGYHPQTDGQTERINQILEQYLRCFIHYQQDNWAAYLHLAEFAYNNSVHSGLGVSPFFANYGFNPRCDVISPANKEVPDFASLNNCLTDALKETQSTYKPYADQLRTGHSKFQIGDKVWLSSKNLTSKRPCSKVKSAL